MGRSVEYRMTSPYSARCKTKALKNGCCPRAITGLAKGFYRAMHSYGMQIPLIRATSKFYEGVKKNSTSKKELTLIGRCLLSPNLFLAFVWIYGKSFVTLQKKCD
jgi:hypothetical protein